MKKLFFLLTVFCTAHSLTAQAEPILKSKKGNYILPQTGDWGIGINTTPLFSYLGSVFSSNTANVASPLHFQNINFHYFIDERNVRRAGLTVNSFRNREEVVVNDLNPDAAAGSFVSDYINRYNLSINLTYGIEKRKGAGRLQGIYGAQGLLGYSTGNKTKMKYGNSMEHYASAVSVQRTVKISHQRPSFDIGAQGFIGFEYFFAPKISVGGELQLSAIYRYHGSGKNEREVWDAAEGKSSFIETSTGNREHETLFGTNLWSNLRLMFYF